MIQASAITQPADSNAHRPAEGSSRLSNGRFPIAILVVVIAAVQMRRRHRRRLRREEELRNTPPSPPA